MTWLRKLWARWFCKEYETEKCAYWGHHAKSNLVRDLPFKTCVGYKCKGCPLKEE